MTQERFLEAARESFGFLLRDYGFRESEPPVTDIAVVAEFSSDVTLIILEICWFFGPDMHVLISVPPPRKIKYASYPLSDLLALRKAPLELPEHSKDEFSEEVLNAQMRVWASALREHASDILSGDHSIFPALADRLEERMRR